MLTNQVTSLGLLRPVNGDSLKKGKRNRVMREVALLVFYLPHIANSVLISYIS
jgi:hypothetical protein